MNTKIIAGFPGTGKSHYHNNHRNTIDLDFSTYYWQSDLPDTSVHPEFPNNYLEAIKEAVGKYEYIFVSSQKDIRDAMKEADIFFYLVYPNQLDKDIYMKRYARRGSTQYFLDLVDANWDLWTRECRWEWEGCENIELPYFDAGREWYLEDVIDRIK